MHALVRLAVEERQAAVAELRGVDTGGRRARRATEAEAARAADAHWAVMSAATRHTLDWRAGQRSDRMRPWWRRLPGTRLGTRMG